MGLAEEAMALTEMRYTKHLIPEHVHIMMKRAREAIVAGRLVPPRTEEDLKTFEPRDLAQ